MARPDYGLIAALLAPLMAWPWVPSWNEEVLKAGVIGAVIFVVSISIFEEVLFRGFLQSWLLRKPRFRLTLSGFSLANCLTSLSFAAAHIWTHSLVLVPGYFVVGIVLGHFRERYGGIRVPVSLHVYYNLGLLFFSIR